MTDETIDDKTIAEQKVVSLRPGKPESRTYDQTMINNSRRYNQNACPHKGPYILDNKLATVECRDCGALLNPLFVLERLAYQEAYWNMRQRDLGRHLAEINQEIEGRARTRCTHCGNMTAIKFQSQMPRTWVPGAYD